MLKDLAGGGGAEISLNRGGAGASVPLTGFGHVLANGVREAVARRGWLGVLTGGLTAAAGGVTAAAVCGVLAALLFRPGTKRRPSARSTVT